MNCGSILRLKCLINSGSNKNTPFWQSSRRDEIPTAAKKISSRPKEITAVITIAGEEYRDTPINSTMEERKYSEGDGSDYDVA